MGINSLGLSQRPYTLSYKDLYTREVKEITRRPPKVLHEILPQDKVELSFNKNIDWLSDEEYEVSHISSRQPNVIQIQQESGATTFVDYSDLRLEEKVAPRPEDIIASKEKYLNWP